MIRTLAERDIEEIMAVSKRCEHLTLERPSIYWTFWELFRDTCYVAVGDKQIIGFLFGTINQHDPTRAFIYNLGVLPERRRGKIATALIGRFCDAAKHRKCKAVYLTTLPENTEAITFYQQIGFKNRGMIEKVGRKRVLLEKDL